VYPELVIRDQTGRIDGVRYDELAPMLLNKMQQQQQINTAQAAAIRDLKRLVVEMQAVLVKLQSKDELVALRRLNGSGQTRGLPSHDEHLPCCPRHSAAEARTGTTRAILIDRLRQRRRTGAKVFAAIVSGRNSVCP
jgi:hypothetical protein